MNTQFAVVMARFDVVVDCIDIFIFKVLSFQLFIYMSNSDISLILTPFKHQSHKMVKHTHVRR